MRKLVKTLLSLSLMAPAAALALGLGDIKLHSALNQRLDADIELLSVDPAEAQDIKVSLASAETFSKVGLERPAVLMFLKFNVEKHSNGKYYISATSNEVIREPFLDFLLEVKWPSGRVLREYTLLLDPPVRHTESAPAVQTPSSGRSMTTPAETSAAPAPSSSMAPPQEGATASPAPRTTSPAPSAAPAAATKPSREGIVYGPVKSNDTLWAIARKLRPNKDVSVQQVMIALLKANPYAFFDNNINRLKKGYVLRLDDPALLTAINKAEAARQVSSQTREWQDYRAAMAEKAQKRQPAVADSETAAGGASAARPEPKLKLVAPEAKSGESEMAAGGEGVEGANEQLMLALESSAAQRKENEALQSRLKDLEEQLQDMQRLLALKDADLAALQQQLKEQGESVELPSDKVEMAEGDAAMAEGKAGDEMPVGKPDAGEEAAAKTESAEEKPAPAAEKPADAAKAEAQQPKTEQKPVAKPKPKPVVRQPRPTPQPSFIESLLQDPMMLAAGGGTLVLLLVLAIVMIRRRRKGGFQESILSGGTSSMMEAKGDEASGETSFLSDLAISGMGGGAITADEGEVDPLTEADVFMAYGRNQQAEEVLKKALESNPDRPEVIAKLFELYYSTQDKAQFEALANESGASVKANDELWAKVASMGHELVPEHELFADVEASSTPATSAQPAAKQEPSTDDVLDIGLDLDELSAEMESEVSDDSFDLGLDLDMDMDTQDEGKKSESASESTEESASSDMDFDLDLGEETESAEPEPEVSADQESTDDLGDLDFDLGELGTEEEKPKEAAPQAESTDDGLDDLDFDLSDFGTESEGETGTSELPAEADEEISFDLDVGEEPAAADTDKGDDLGDMDLGDLDFGDLDLEVGADETGGGEEAAELDLGDLDTGTDEDDFGDLGDLDDEGLLGDSDEITTKLDLAQAYIEMGDNDGARSMLEEVVEAGNDEQKQQAQELLGKI